MTKSSVSSTEQQMLRTMTATIESHRMLENGDAVLVAVSGGPDSMALLNLLLQLAAARSLHLGIAHINHQLRGRSAESDATFVRNIAKKYHLPFYVETADVGAHQKRHGLSPEEAARQIRYRLLVQIAVQRGYVKIAVGHHRSDNAELVLMRILQGSGPRGISGIPPVRQVQSHALKLVRPLINIEKDDIVAYLTEKNIDAVQDQSNRDERFLRNRIRGKLLPLLQSEYNTNIIDSLNRLAAISRSEENWIEELITTAFKKVVIAESPQNITLSIPRLAKLHPAVIGRTFRKAIDKIKGNLRRITFQHINAAMALISDSSQPKFLHFPDQILVRRNGDTLSFSRQNHALRHRSYVSKAFEYRYTIFAPGSLYIKEADARMRFSLEMGMQPPDFSNTGQSVAFFDMNSVGFPLIIRNLRTGDRFKPLGMQGTQKVKDFFINNKLNRASRDRCPLVLWDDKIIWVAGYRIAEDAKITDSTRNVLRVELLLA